MSALRVIKSTAAFVCLSVIFYQCATNDPEPVDCTSTGPAVVVNSTTDATCNQDNGEIDITVTGGTGLEFSIAGSTFQPISAGNATITDIPSGSLTITIRDANSCTASATFTINDTNNLAIDLATEDSGCLTSNGSISVTPSGGAEPYAYSLDGGSFQSDASFSGLEAGDYTVFVQDDEGCETSTTISILNGVSYMNEVQSIIDTNCAVSGCHDGSNGSDRNWTVFSNVQNSAAGIKSRTAAGTMPPAGSGLTLDQSEIDAIGCWVDDGALDN